MLVKLMDMVHVYLLEKGKEHSEYSYFTLQPPAIYACFFQFSLGKVGMSASCRFILLMCVYFKLF